MDSFVLFGPGAAQEFGPGECPCRLIDATVAAEARDVLARHEKRRERLASIMARRIRDPDSQDKGMYIWSRIVDQKYDKLRQLLEIWPICSNKLKN